MDKVETRNMLKSRAWPLWVPLLLCLSSGSLKAQQKPNVIFILTDDLGYGDIGVFFQAQRQKSGDRSLPYQLTPHLDQMAAQGARFTQQYANAPVCAPSRASFLTGVHQGNAVVRDNQFDKMLENNHTVASVLRAGGYKTVAIGKWGLQGQTGTGPASWPGYPLKRGFDDYFGYVRHSDGHEHYPFEGLYRGKKEVWSGNEEVSAGLEKCYTTDLWTAAAKRWITSHRSKSNQPFFMYLAYDAPHAVLELPTQAYPKGGGLHGGLQWLGKKGEMINTASGHIDSYLYPEYGNATYDDDHDPLSPEVPWPDTFKRYATAVRRIDDAIGDIRQLLVDLHIEGNTLVVFTSDNGPSIESYLPKGFAPNEPTFFASYGPFDGIKRDCWEGGLRMPGIAVWPGRIAANKMINTPSMLSDWAPTFARAAGLAVPARMDGVSLLPVLTGKGPQDSSQVYVEYFEAGKTPGFKEFEAGRRNRKRGQMQMIRLGDLVGVRYGITRAEDNFEIYNVVTDPKQTSNLALKPGYDQIQQQMKNKVLQRRRADTESPRPYDNALVPADQVDANMQPGLLWKYYPGNFAYVGNTDGLKPLKAGKVDSVQGREWAGKKGLLSYEAYVKVPQDGAYTFSLKTSGKAFVRLHEATLIDADFAYAPGELKAQKVRLGKGFHKITLNAVFTGAVAPVLSLGGQGEGQVLQFYHLNKRN